MRRKTPCSCLTSSFSAALSSSNLRCDSRKDKSSSTVLLFSCSQGNPHHHLKGCSKSQKSYGGNWLKKHQATEDQESLTPHPPNPPIDLKAELTNWDRSPHPRIQAADASPIKALLRSL
ncbi:hypothetical protein SRHO_G00299940 [Serrasalmus rhombeus]